ncbi:MAG: methylenetetrahydrofolate reductase [NAD(P)H] [Pseudohongiellaceae bacterium]
MSPGKNRQGCFSFEFFPPRTPEGEQSLLKTHKELASLGPDFFSVTYGAGGSTREGTRRIVLRLKDQGSSVVPHLSFGSSSEAELLVLLNSYRDAGIDRLVVLRGDIPSGMGSGGQYRYAAELVAFVREKFGNQFHIDVACYPEVHPQAESYEADLAFFRLKVNAGADSAITQYFYSPDAYFHFRDRCLGLGINIPIVPGIMPITNYVKLARFSANCGAEIPRWIRRCLEGYGDDSDSIRAFGIDVVSSLCETLLQEGAPGLHFYCMNQSSPAREIWQNLNLPVAR